LDIEEPLANLAEGLMEALRTKVNTDRTISPYQWKKLQGASAVVNYLNTSLETTLDAVLQPAGYKGSIGWDWPPNGDAVLEFRAHAFPMNKPICKVLNRPIAHKIELGVIKNGGNSEQALFEPFYPTNTVLKTTPLRKLPEYLDIYTLTIYEPILSGIQSLYPYVDMLTSKQWDRLVFGLGTIFHTDFTGQPGIRPSDLIDVAWRDKLTNTVADILNQWGDNEEESSHA
jgi:hypothetical protein